MADPAHTSAPAPSRYAAYRKRKASGSSDIRPRRTAAQLDALEAKAPEQRDADENRALRDRQKNRKRTRVLPQTQERELAEAQSAHASVTASAIAVATVATAACATAAAAPPSLLPSPIAAAPLDSLASVQSALEPSTEEAGSCTRAVLPIVSEPPLPSSLQTASSAAPIAAARASDHTKSSSSADGVEATPPRLLQCALRFVRRLAKGAPRCLPFSCMAAQLPALLLAVQQRIHADSSTPLDDNAATAAGAAAASATSSSCSSSSALDTASSAPTLCAEDEQLVRSLFTQLQHWPDSMQQLWTATGARKLTEEQIGQLREQAALHDYVRDVALRHRPRIGCETAHPDRTANVQASMRVGSAMDEFVFSVGLRHLIDRAPGLPMMHVPPQLSVMWQMSPHQAPAAVPSAAAAAGARSQPESCPMAEWFRKHHTQMLDARYLVLHWCSGHFCSIIVDLHVWKAGPLGGLSSVIADDAAAVASTPAAHASASSAPSIAHCSQLSLPSSSPMADKRTRRPSRALKVAQADARSTTCTPVPLLHLDTLPSACSFTADKRALLRLICIELNRRHAPPSLTFICMPRVKGPLRQ